MISEVEDWLGRHTRDKIFLEALRVHFVQAGGDVRRIAKSLGIGVASVYRHLDRLKSIPKVVPVPVADMEEIQGSVEFRDMPWPPSVNHYYSSVGSRRFLTKRAREYRSAMRDAIWGQILEQYPWLPKLLPITCDLDLRVAFHPPDKRVRDNDNYNKAFYDACTKAGLWKDDRQVKITTMALCDPVQGGAVHMKLSRYEGITW